MIGLACEASQRDIAEEFFELFKTPWEYYRFDRDYEIVIATVDVEPAPHSKCLLLFGLKDNGFDMGSMEVVAPSPEGQIVKYGNRQFPIYTGMVAFGGEAEVALELDGSDKKVALKIKKGDQTIYRIGYDFLDEIRFLLESGQPPLRALVPTLEIHISVLRKFILESGVPLVEIPPVPAGYSYVVCLTHDIDFAGIRFHHMDRTMLGYCYRASVGSVIDFIRRKKTCGEVLINWGALARLPLVYFGFCKDYWAQFTKYQEIEKDFGSTFFIIPYKKRPGKDGSGRVQIRRATKYDVDDVAGKVRDLIRLGCEVGVHGIDAWKDEDCARDELERIARTTGVREVGIRIHWLYFSERSWHCLESAGFSYDSTIGYNDAIGYRAGTTQIFRPPGTRKIFELPLHVQDTAMFFPGRMALSRRRAWELVLSLFENCEHYGGTVTINWHDRSLFPERLWDTFYRNLLAYLSERKVWFAPANRVVQWFEQRRSVSFDYVHVKEDVVSVKVASPSSVSGGGIPEMALRVHFPRTNNKGKHIDMLFSGSIEQDIRLN